MLSLVFRTLIHFRGLLFPVALGVAVATAVILGALIVGDSMRGSLRFIAMDRIGAIESVVMAPRWFNEDLALNLKQYDPSLGSVHGLILAQQSIAENGTHRASEMSLFGVEQEFWTLGDIQPSNAPGDEEVILNQTLADKLHAQNGDLITLRVASQSVVPADSPLGKREQDSVVLPRWKVIEILPDRSLSRFSLRSDQRPIMNAFVGKRWLQKSLEVDSKVNAVIVSHFSKGIGKSPSGHNNLLEKLAPNLADLGLSWQHVQRTSLSAPTASTTSKDVRPLDYHQLTTDQMLMTSGLSEAILVQTKAQAPKSVLTYLANGIQQVQNGQRIGRNVPYSTVSAVDWTVLSKMLEDSMPESDRISPTKPTQENWVVVTNWLAEELSVAVGDTITIEYFLPETVDGEEVEKSFEAVVLAIAPLTPPIENNNPKRAAQYDRTPSQFNDSAWTPNVPGITDQESISKWDTPFPLTRKVSKADDQYWTDHRLTPKLYISSELGIKHFGSRFGKASSIRFDDLKPDDAAEVEKQITKIARTKMSDLGWREIPLLQQQLRASSGTTPFDALFLSLSFFVIVAALLLVALLFRLAIEQRANHWGLLMASGWTRSGVRRLLLLEGAVLCTIGATLGIVLGLGYAYAMIAGLHSWWVGAITVSFLEYHVSPLSIVLGWSISWLAALVTILTSTRQLKSIPIARLLRNQMEVGVTGKRSGSTMPYLSIGCMVAAIGTLMLGQFLQGQAQAGAFVGGGMLFLIGGLSWTLGRLKNVSTNNASTTKFVPSMMSASSLASSNAKRAPMRSILAIGLVSIASFLILSMSLFQASPDEAGTGGFAFIGKSSQAIHIDLANPAKQKAALGPKMAALSGLEFVPLRVRGGDDASCNNLYQASQPQVLGISARMATIDQKSDGRSAFAWFATENAKDATPWHRLQSAADGTVDSPVPVVLDQNTALWALHLGGYVGEKFSYTFDDRKVYFKTVGVSQNTILQGSLIIGESNFEKLFPSITGHRLFLVKSTDDSKGIERLAHLEKARMVLEDGWSESGLSLASSDSVLKQLLAVQNTYLGAFQVLGALGLLLGTIGLGVSQLRNAIERRGELAAMRAIGFTKSRLVWLLTLENGWQLMRGIGIGVGAAALATLPSLLSGQPFSGLAWPGLMMTMVILSGLLCSILAAWVAMQWPLLKALRSDK
jgi:putative ABC transport system permease protein